jgi:hypothetical protein
MNTLQTVRKAQLTHLLDMARSPAFVDHAWHRIDALDAHDCGLWKGIKQAFEREMAMRGLKRSPKVNGKEWWK